ncbi:g3672 [Coccomyxa viridis]|uniref:G3672 protein n=1 Tax=Coccomyxa viridis TaxID=1274662 RepID=A0ABP1FTH5_9CHLO
MYEEYETSEFIREALDKMKIDYRHPVAKTGVVGMLGKGKPVVALRADMDALPILEQTGFSFQSKTPGKMHACGHDAHVTMLLGAARILKEHEAELAGSVRLIFQPAEEGGAGGELMVQEGVLDGVDAIFGQHVWPFLPSGTLGSRAGALMGACQQFQVTIKGRGGHAAMPHTVIDPIVASSHVILALQALVSRETSPLGTAVVSVTKQAAGEGAYNVIPESASFGGTIRSLSHDHLMQLKRRINEVAQGVATSFQCSAEVDWLEETEKYYPPTVNNKETYKFAMQVGRSLLGDPEKFHEDYEPTLGGEDFSFYGQAGVPAAFVFLGMRNESAGAVHGVHTPQFTLDEEVLQTGAAYLASLAAQYLEQHGGTTAHQEL